MKTKMLCLAALVAGLPLDAPAQEDAPPNSSARRPSPAERFARIDSDKNGEVNRKEFDRHVREMVAQSVARLDKDGNGTLSKAEVEQAQNQRRDRRRQRGLRVSEQELTFEKFDEADTDDDGELSVDEMYAAGQDRRHRRFDVLDANDDQVVSEAEFIEQAEKTQKRIRQRRRGRSTN
jgi:hypothetical protein